jgi:hypothetical protein
MTNRTHLLKTAALLAALTLAGAACSDDTEATTGTTVAAADSSTSAPATTESAPETTVGSADTTSTTGAATDPEGPATGDLVVTGAGVDGVPSCESISGSSPAVFDAGAGTYASHLVDTTDPAAIDFDIVQWVESDDAPNGFEVVNDNPTVRTAALAEPGEIWLVAFGEDETAIDLVPGELPDGNADAVYWLTFDGGDIVEVCQQYVP